MNIQRLSDKMLKRYEDALRCGEKLTYRQRRALENHYFITHRRHPADTLRTENARLQKERNTLRELVKFEQRQKVLAGNAVIKACNERDALRDEIECTRQALVPLTAESAAPTSSEKQPCPLCEGSGQYINTCGNPVFPCNACGGAGMVD